MKDKNPALSSKLCNKCGKFGLRLYISYHFIEHYGVYCTECGYKTKPSPSSQQGCQEWVNAETPKENISEMINRINEEFRKKDIHLV